MFTHRKITLYFNQRDEVILLLVSNTSNVDNIINIAMEGNTIEKDDYYFISLGIGSKMKVFSLSLSFSLYIFSYLAFQEHKWHHTVMGMVHTGILEDKGHT